MSYNDDKKEGVTTSVVDEYSAPDKGDFLHSDIPEDKVQAEDGLIEASVAAADQLTGEQENQWQAWNSAEAVTNAAVAAGETDPRPAVTVGEETHPVDQTVAESYTEGVTTSVVDQYSAPNKNDFLHSDIPETEAKAKSGLEEASIAAADQLTGEQENQWQAWNSAESQTDAAVAAGLTKPHPAPTAGEEELEQCSVNTDVAENVATSVIDKYAAPNIGDTLHSDIPETKKEEVEGLEEATGAADYSLEGDTVNQWQAEGSVESETDAAVADGADRPHPGITAGEEE